MTIQRPVHLVGSVPLADAETVFREVGAHLGTVAKRYPDGETGVRLGWLRWQRPSFDNNPAFEIDPAATNIDKYKDNLDRRNYRIKPGTDPKTIEYQSLGYASEAAKSYAVFAKLKKAGAVPASARFQVSLPTALAIVSGFVVVADRASAEPAMERTLARELAEIGKTIPANELTVQWDVCLELLGYDGGPKLHLEDILPESIERIARQIAMVPAGAEVGIHLCYGDPGHKHVVEPKDSTSMVTFANAIVEKSPRPIAYIHMPILRGWDEDKYFAPLKGLKVPTGTEIFLGLVHMTDGMAGAKKRLALAQKFVKNFGVATECGLGRREPSTIAPLLDLHREISTVA